MIDTYKKTLLDFCEYSKEHYDYIIRYRMRNEDFDQSQSYNKTRHLCKSLLHKIPSLTDKISRVEIMSSEEFSNRTVLGCFYPEIGEVQIRPFEYFDNSVGFFFTLLHELSHSLDDILVSLPYDNGRLGFMYSTEPVIDFTAIKIFDKVQITRTFAEVVADISSYLCLCEIYYWEDIMDRICAINYQHYEFLKKYGLSCSFKKFIKSLFGYSIELFNKVKQYGVVDYISEWLALNPEYKTM